jgi:hypothetical protein
VSKKRRKLGWWSSFLLSSSSLFPKTRKKKKEKKGKKRRKSCINEKVHKNLRNPCHLTKFCSDDSSDGSSDLTICSLLCLSSTLPNVMHFLIKKSS